jgi:hypothetical protein
MTTLELLARARGGEGVKSGPIGLAVILVLCIAAYFLFKSMSKHLRRVRENFPEDTTSTGTATTGTASSGPASGGTERQPAPTAPAAPEAPDPAASSERTPQPPPPLPPSAPPPPPDATS